MLLDVDIRLLTLCRARLPNNDLGPRVAHRLVILGAAALGSLGGHLAITWRPVRG
jgi:hypothetical protein